MAPEVLDVSMEATGDGYTLKADIWSFSMLVFEIISLLPPYHQFPHLQTVEMILKGTPPPLTSNISPNLSGLIDLLHHCIDINPSKRPTASQVVSKLVKLLKSSVKTQCVLKNK
ncbi:protein serine/threonine kinase [Heterostelium album PN500]|uniref:Protein serine/threonine kinase n=1 Tax=Heterostelium pallidum (strain ATCC 26659 / Pp 5 / PN500) TaxID=670386 RepID=D3BCP0_HETP5|nr:protein serine/threonine kinase [Heterostelium album PN500]EFA80682.1 protein serine/threonine kinase [Heterostelium album PN500]|eukprot:XP_020432802.1 protein serine/threonine kinase [Heterostelium album PN500]